MIAEIATAFAPYLAVFFAPFAHESLAIAGAAVLIVERGMPPLLVGAALVAGVVASDFAIYGLGRLAHRSQMIRRLVTRAVAERPRAWLERNMLALILVSRVVPGVLFPTFLALGWYGISFKRFALISSLSAAIYTPALLVLAVTFGATAQSYAGHWYWIGGFVALAAVAVWLGRLARRWFDRSSLAAAATNPAG